MCVTVVVILQCDQHHAGQFKWWWGKAGVVGSSSIKTHTRMQLGRYQRAESSEPSPSHNTYLNYHSTRKVFFFFSTFKTQPNQTFYMYKIIISLQLMLCVFLSGPNRIGRYTENKGKHAGGGKAFRERLGPARLLYAITSSFSYRYYSRY